ncbi:pentapeptide repeat-containing protein [Streptomyces sp. 891-h]|uniref:pentapeptide repeat-containing protein n=1 Tax=Streptomyces sp. 891-h TaxID=2720714 RepID=UPI001FA9F0D5|nr:pentapeptide repeat-containing protein [Streptomyces sp. 891-h]
MVAATVFFAGWNLLEVQGLKPERRLTSKTLFDLVKLSFGVVAGAGALVALVVAYRRQRVDEDGARRDVTRLHTERFTTAVGQLGDDSPAVRLGGVHALAGLADDAPTPGLRQSCIDVLCAYLRLPYTPESDLPPDDAEARHAYLALREVRHTIIRLTRDHLRLPPDHPHTWQGHDLDCTGVVFDGADFSGAVFSGGTVDFSGATFSHGTVDFIGTVFSGGTIRFTRAEFSRGTVRFTRAVFSGGTVDFSGATFSRGTVDFSGATFSHGTVDFIGTVFSGGTIRFTRAEFSRGTVDFSGAVFSGGTVDFSGATFSRYFGTADSTAFGFIGHIITARLSRGTIEAFPPPTRGTVRFSGATFSGGTVDFSGATFSRGTVYFSGATFSGGTVDFTTVREDAVPSGLVPAPGEPIPSGLLLPHAWRPAF